MEGERERGRGRGQRERTEAGGIFGSSVSRSNSSQLISLVFNSFFINVRQIAVCGIGSCATTGTIEFGKNASGRVAHRVRLRVYIKILFYYFACYLF